MLSIILLAALGAAGQWRAAAVVVPPGTTNRVALAWCSLATNVSLAFIGGQERMFRLSASNTPPQSATLAWNPSVPSTNVAGYFMYYGATPDSYTNRVDVGLGTNVVVTNLSAGKTYYFAATAYTSAGLESDYSNEAAWQCPLRLKIQRSP